MRWELPPGNGSFDEMWIIIDNPIADRKGILKSKLLKFMYQIIEQSLHNSQYKLEDVQEIEDSDDLGQERIEPPNSSPKLIKSTQKQPIILITPISILD